MEAAQEKSQRIDWIDVAKGITMLLVILGHSTIPATVKGAIFSFHMPLFFILSGITFRLSATNDAFIKKTERAFVHLFLPAAGIFACLTVFRTLRDHAQFARYGLPEIKAFLANCIAVFIGGSGVKIKIGAASVAAIGIPWFLMCLFFGRTLFDYLNLKLSKKQMYGAVVLASVIGVCLGRVQWLPFSWDIALAIQPLFLVARWLKTYDMKAKAKSTCAVSLVVWLASFFLIRGVTGSFLELASRRYVLFPLCYVCACAGTMFVSSLSQLLLWFKTLIRPIQYIGKHSMVLLWIHCLDYLYPSVYKLTASGTVNALIRIGLDLGAFAVVMAVITLIKKRKKNKADTLRITRAEEETQPTIPAE